MMSQKQSQSRTNTSFLKLKPREIEGEILRQESSQTDQNFSDGEENEIEKSFTVDKKNQKIVRKSIRNSTILLNNQKAKN